MASRQLSCTSTVLLFATLILCSLNGAFSLKCYTCISTANSNCTEEYAHETILTNCNVSSSFLTVTMNPNWIPILPPGVNPVEDTGAYECVSLQFTIPAAKDPSTDGVLRSCVPKGLSISFFESQTEAMHVTVKNVKICDSDSCNVNSSSMASISLWTMFSTLAAMLYLARS